MYGKEIEGYIRKRFSDGLFNVNCLIRELHASESYLREIINLNYHCSPHHLIENVRLEAAIRLLGHPPNTMYSICKQIGYSNLKTFRRAFKKRTGVSPKEFRDMISESENDRWF